MTQTISMITEVAKIEKAISAAQVRQEEIDFKKDGEMRKLRKLGKSSTSIAVDLVEVNAELAFVNEQIDSLPPGTERENRVTEQYGLIFRKRSLENRQKSYDPISVLECETDIAMFEAELGVLQTLIAALEQRRTELSQQSAA